MLGSAEIKVPDVLFFSASKAANRASASFNSFDDTVGVLLVEAILYSLQLRYSN